MLHQESFKGFWFPADRPEIRFQAALSFGPDRSPRLEGVGTFNEEQANYLRKTKDITIWGNLENGIEVSLFECNLLSMLLPFSGTQNLEMNAQTIVLGVHLATSTAEVFDAAYLTYTALGEWMNIYGHRHAYDQASKTYSMSYEPPEDIEFTINERLSGALLFRLHREIKGSAASFRQENLLSINYASPVSYDEVRDTLWKFQRFFTILTWQQLNIVSFSVRMKNSEAADDEDLFKWCRIFFRQSAYGYGKEEPHGYFLRFATVRPVLEKLLQGWFRLESLVDPIISLLIANIGVGKEFVQNNFLNLVQAVEAYHRHIKQDTERLKAQHAVRMEQILAEVQGAANRKWLSDKLTHSYEPSLRKRLNQLFAENCSIVFYNKEVPKKSVVSVINLITKKRNYYTHYGEKIVPNNGDFIQLFVLTDLLKLLLAVMIFRELGVDKEILKEQVPGRLKVNLAAKGE